MKPVLSPYLLVIAAMLLFVQACTTSRQVTSGVFEDLYRIDAEFQHDFFVKQVDASSATMFFTLRTDQLLHKRKGPESDYKVLCDFKVVLHPEEGQSIDTLYYRYAEVSDASVANEFLASVAIPVKDTTAYRVEVLTTDMHSGKTVVDYVFLSTKASDMRYVRSRLLGREQAYCSCTADEELLIQLYGESEGVLELKTFDIEMELAPPPFSVSPSPVPSLTLKDSSVVSHQGVLAISCPGKSVLRFSSDQRKVDVPVFRPGFPELADMDEMMAVLKYMTTSSEYKDMRLSEDPRRAFEYFWLDCGGSKERARVLIDNYYTRVQEANTYFSGLVEGWKTDRGLIHIIYGPPAHIVRLSDRELWYYGSDNSESTLKMVFYKSGGYRLDRSLDYRQSWYLTVDSWRSGRTIGK